MDREQALDVALGQIERNFGKGAVMKMSDQAHVSVGAISTGSLSLDLALGIGGLPARPHRRDLRPRVVGQDDPRLPRDRRGPAPRRHLRLHRRRARDGPDVREADRRQHRRAARLAARHGRAGARDHRAPDPLRRARGGRDRLGRRAHAEGRDRGRDGRLARRPPGPADVAGAPQARRHAQPHRHDLHLHEPAPREDRRDVRQPRGDAGRPRAQVLLVGPARHPPHRDAQGRRRGGRQPRAASRWRRTRSRRRSSRPSSTSCTARASPGRAPSSTRASTARSSRSRGSYFSFGDERLGQGRQNATAFLKEHPDLVQQILQGIQATMAPGQIVSARLLPQLEASRGRSPAEVEVEAEAEAEAAAAASRSDVAPRVTALVAEPREPRARRARRRAVARPAGGRRRRRPGSRSGASSTGRARGRSVASCAALEALRDRDGRAGAARPLGRRASRRGSSGAASRRRSGRARWRRSSAPATSTTRASPPPARPRSRRAATATRRSASTSSGTASPTSPSPPRSPGSSPRAQRARALIGPDGRAPEDGASPRGEGLLGRAVEAALGEQDVRAVDG